MKHGRRLLLTVVGVCTVCAIAVRWPISLPRCFTGLEQIMCIFITIIILYELFVVSKNKKKKKTVHALTSYHPSLVSYGLCCLFVFYFVSCFFFTFFPVSSTLLYNVPNHILTDSHVHCVYYRTVPPRRVMRFSNFIILARIISGGAVVRIVY